MTVTETTATEQATATKPPPVEVPEAVTDQPSATAPAVVTPQHSALERAAEAAMAMPGVPGVDEFLALAMQARILSMSGAAPDAIKGNPHVAFHVAMVGRDLGISPSAAIELIDVIQTSKGPRLSLSPQLLNGQLRRLGLGSVVPATKRADLCVAVALGPGGVLDHRCARTWPEHVDGCECHRIIGETEFGWEDAQTAELAGPNCLPGDHKKDQKRSSGGREWMVCGCNQGYITYPKRMMWWRAAGFCTDDYFPEAGLGLYTAEELGSIVDVEGRPLDPAQVALPAGYEPQVSETERKATTTAPADELWDFQERARALPEAQREEMRARFKQADKLKKYTVATLPEGSVLLFRSMLTGFEKIAAKAGWNAAEARADVQAQWLAGLTACLTRWLPLDAAPGDPPQPTGGPESDVPVPDPTDDPPTPEGPADGQEAPDPPPVVTPPTEEGPTTADALKRELAAVGEADQEMVAAIAEVVGKLDTAEVNARLVEHGLDPEDLGDPENRRARLTVRLVWERAQLAEGDGTAAD